MNQEQFETMKGLIAQVEIKAIVYGRACSAEDTNENESMAKALNMIKAKAHRKWGEASKELHDFMETLKEPK